VKSKLLLVRAQAQGNIFAVAIWRCCFSSLQPMDSVAN